MATVAQTQPQTSSLGEQVRAFWARNGFAIALLVPALIYLLFFLIIITFYLLRLSLTYQPVPGAAGVFPSVQNYVDMATSPAFQAALWRTIWFVAIGTPLQLFAGLALAMMVNRAFVGRGFVRSVLLLPLAIPGLVTAVIVASMLFSSPFGHVNDLLTGRHAWFPQIVGEPINWRGDEVTALGLALGAKVWRDVPISMLILLAGLQSIEADQYEAARTMGATVWHRFIYITIPLLVPAIATVLVLRSIEMWKEFLFPFIIAPSFPVIGVLIDQLYNSQKLVTYSATVAVLLIVCIGVSTFILTVLTRALRAYLVRV